MAQKDHGFSSNGSERITYKLGRFPVSVFGPSCRMPDLHLKPSIAAYGAAMSACDAAAAWSNAISLLDEMLLLGAAVFVFKRENTGESDDYENV